ncbi:MAG: hypothetical protein KDK10_04165 [Maritimibacter sp.]|nr:hypothetical protein [Maritimibacter sp.]
MTDPLAFGPDRGLRELWLFALHLPADQVEAWAPPRPNGPARPWPMEDALGAGPLDPAHVQVFEPDDLGKHGLRKFLADALGMDQAQVEADAGKLDGLHAVAVIVHDRALIERPGAFAPRLPLRFIGHYSVAQHLAPAAPLAAGLSTEGVLPGPAGASRPSPALRRGLAITLAALAALVLVVLALA